jgi:hypothetical protein
VSERRVYLPLSRAELETIAGPQGAVTTATGYAVTARLRRADPGADEEQLEYAAFLAAAAEAARRRQGARTRRVVAAADLDEAVVVDADGADTAGLDADELTAGQGGPDGLDVDHVDAEGADDADESYAETFDADTVGAAAADDLGRVRLAAPVTRTALVSLHLDEEPAGEDALLWYDVTELPWVRDLFG